MATKTFTARPMNNVSEFIAPVDIIIPFHGQYDKVTKLLESIYLYTRANHIQIYLIDDHSPNEEFVQIIAKNIGKSSTKRNLENNFHALRCKERHGFAGAAKRAFEQGENPYVCFLNSDCVVEDPLWIQHLGEALLNHMDKGVRMVAPVTNNAVGGDPAQEGDKLDKSNEIVILEDDSHLSMYCFMCHRQLFDKCGGFLKEYPYGYFEDEEFAARMKKKGFKQAVCKNAWIFHHGMSTIRSVWKDDITVRDVMEKGNRDKCIADIKSLG
jgi:GT2 family glycosyltransferase